MKKNRFKPDMQLIAGILLNLALFFMLTVFEPLCFFFQNKYEFIYDVYTILPILLVMFVAFFVLASLLSLVLYKISKKVFFVIEVIEASLLICLYLQGNYFVGALPQLGTVVIDWRDFYPLYVQSVVMWLLIFAVCIGGAVFLKRERFLKISCYASIFLTAVLLVTVITKAVMTKGFDKRLDIQVTSHNNMEYSSDTNFIILVIDALDANGQDDFFEKNPDYKEVYKDFTYYTNYTSGYIKTARAIPLLLSGEYYEWGEDDESMEVFKSRTLRHAPIIDEVMDRGYKVGMYTIELPVINEDVLDFDNVLNSEERVSEPIAFAKVWLRIVGYKYLPYPLKRYSQVLSEEFSQHLESSISDRNWTWYESNMYFYNESANMRMSVSDDKRFKLIHIQGCHTYWDALNENMEFVPTEYYGEIVRTANILAETYLNRLKEDGIYDNSVIIITSDHGYNGNASELIKGNQDAVLFIKGIGETHDKMLENAAPIAEEDLSDAYFKLLDGDNGNNVFPYKEGDYRERRMFDDEYSEEYVNECLQTGEASDGSTIKETGHKYKRNGVY